MSKLVDRVPSSKSSTTTVPTPSVGFTPSSTSTAITESATLVLSTTGAAAISPSSSSFGESLAAPTLACPADSATTTQTLQSATADTALQVFGEMPTPRAEYENYCCGKPNTIQSSCVHSGSTNISEQCISGIPQSYGFHNLSMQSLIRADGTVHSYFTLPADYPLEQDVTEPVFDVYADETDGYSHEFVDVFASTTDQQPYEEQHENRQVSKCFSKPIFSPERPIVGTVGLFSLTNEQSVCDLEKLNDGEKYLGRHGQCIQQFQESVFISSCAMGDVQLLPDYKLNVLLTGEGRDIWDPGASLPFLSSKIQHPAIHRDPDRDAAPRDDADTPLPGMPIRRRQGCRYAAAGMPRRRRRDARDAETPPPGSRDRPATPPPPLRRDGAALPPRESS